MGTAIVQVHDVGAGQRQRDHLQVRQPGQVLLAQRDAAGQGDGRPFQAFHQLLWLGVRVAHPVVLEGQFGRDDARPDALVIEEYDAMFHEMLSYFFCAGT
ncbi:hypothetical protein D9M70_610850 [compost metagenome]